MSLSRRDFLRLGGLATVAATATSCSVVGRQLAQDELPRSLSAPGGAAGPSADGHGRLETEAKQIKRLLDRAGYGPRPGDIQRAKELGIEAYLYEQLNPEAINDAAAELIVRGLTTYHMDADQLINQEPADVAIELAIATVGRALYSKRQLYEAMVEFWSDHFNIYVRKNQIMLPLKVVDDREVIRPHALGKFRDLLFASAQSPAMLVYLDNVRNIKGSPNENYARELMELHTIGVDAGYAQRDVQEVARALTGWGVQRRGPRQGELRFYENQHDDGPKELLGHTLPAGQGQDDVWQVLEIVAGRPATARFISTKLVRRFVADSPPAGLVEQVTQTFMETDGDIRSLLGTIFLSQEFVMAPPKLKRPYTFLVSALRSLNSDVAAYRPLIRWLELLGQPLFQWAAPDGYPDVSESWSANLLPRWNFGLAFLANQLRGVRAPLLSIVEAGQVGGTGETLELFAGLILGRALDDEARTLFTEYVGDGRLVDREQRTRLRESIALMLASPAFQWT